MQGDKITNKLGKLRVTAKPNEAYFRHVDDIVKYAEKVGLFMGMLPTWGASWKLAARFILRAITCN